MNQKIYRQKAEYQYRIFFPFFICLIIVSWFIQTSDQFLHWFIIPIVLSGILMGIDAIDWYRGRLQLFDPVGILGLLGFHFFFLSPLLHVSLDYWLKYVTPPEDWRPWLGGMAILNCLGILVYKNSRKIGQSCVKNRFERNVWKIYNKRFPIIMAVAIIIALMLQIMVFQKYGGIIGYITTYTEESSQASKDAFAGMGIIFLFSESLPILAMIWFATYAKKNKCLQTWPILLIVLILFMALQIICGGLRGSRSTTIWALFWAVGIIHFWIRPINKKIVCIGLIFLLLFMYSYGFYKKAGLDAWEITRNQQARVELIEQTGLSWESIVLQDFGRSDIQAFLLYRLMKRDSDYEYSLGRTYLGTVAILIPKAIWPKRPPTKHKEGTDAQFGMGSYAPGRWVSSKVYGLAGETMLNFGPFIVPFAFVILGFFVGYIQRSILTFNSSDARLMLLPMLTNLCFIILIGDSDNILFFLLKTGAFPYFIIWLGSSKQKG